MPNAQYWRDRASEALQQAAEMDDGWFRWQLIQIAVGYHHLAKRTGEDKEADTSVSTSPPVVPALVVS